jgi:hypothetical protein
MGNGNSVHNKIHNEISNRKAGMSHYQKKTGMTLYNKEKREKNSVSALNYSEELL